METLTVYKNYEIIHSEDSFIVNGKPFLTLELAKKYIDKITKQWQT